MTYNTDIKSVDDALNGGFPNNRVGAIFGPPNIGKSVLCCQISINAMSRDENIYYISSVSEKDSESYFDLFKDRYSVSKRPEFNSLSHLSDLGSLLDKHLKILYSNEKAGNKETVGKASVIIRDETAKEIVDKVWRREHFKDYNLIILDSISEFLKMGIIHEMQNLPARSIVQNFLFSAFNDVMSDYDSTVILTHHVTKTISFRSTTYPFGGPGVLYLSKYLLEIDKPKKDCWNRYKDEARSLRRYRWPAKVTSDWICARLKRDWGFEDKIEEPKSRKSKKEEREEVENKIEGRDNIENIDEIEEKVI